LGHPNSNNSFAGSGRTLLSLASNNVKHTASILSTKTIKAVAAAPLLAPSLLDDDIISVGNAAREKEDREQAEKAAVATAVDAALKRGAAEAIQASRAASIAKSKLMGQELQSMYNSLTLGDASSVETAASRDEEGRSLAHLAAAAGDQGMFVLYALKKVNAAMLLAKDAAGLTPLHYACAVGAKGVAAWLCSQPGGEISSLTKDILQRIPLDLVPTESGENDWKFLL
jgi:ankyrin repeat protein